MSEAIASKSVSITTVGGAGVATGTGTISGVYGFLLNAYIDYHASAPATTVVIITDSNGVELLHVPASKTDTRYYPMKEIQTDHIAATGLYTYASLYGDLTVTVTLSDAMAACVVVTVRYMATAYI